MEKFTDEEIVNEMNQEPEKFLPYFNPFDSILYFLAAYGWWAIGFSIVFIWVYNRFRPSYDKWKIQKEDAEYHKNPDIALKRMEAIEAARARQQQLLNATAEEYKIKEEAKQEKKRQEYIDRNSGNSSGNRLGSKSDYFPLCGPGTSGGYKPPKKSKCSGGGCGR